MAEDGTINAASGVPPLLKVAAHVFIAVFCGNLLLNVASMTMRRSNASGIKIESTVKEPAPVLPVLVRDSQSDTLSAMEVTLIVCIGYAGWRRRNNHAMPAHIEPNHGSDRR
jgi:ABC-type methionine transport system permease subunit